MILRLIKAACKQLCTCRLTLSLLDLSRLRSILWGERGHDGKANTKVSAQRWQCENKATTDTMAKFQLFQFGAGADEVCPRRRTVSQDLGSPKTRYLDIGRTNIPTSTLFGGSVLGGSPPMFLNFFTLLLKTALVLRATWSFIEPFNSLPLVRILCR